MKITNRAIFLFLTTIVRYYSKMVGKPLLMKSLTLVVFVQETGHGTKRFTI